VIEDDIKIVDHPGWCARFEPSGVALATHIDAYVQSHLGDMVPEDRWRTDLSKKLNRVLSEMQSLATRAPPTPQKTSSPSPGGCTTSPRTISGGKEPKTPSRGMQSRIRGKLEA